MTTVDLELDSEILSPNEKAPVAPDKPVANVASLTCRYCPEIFEGTTRAWTRGRHEKAQHRALWEAAKVAPKPKAKKAAKAAPAAKKAPAPRPAAKRIPAGEAIGRNVARIGKMLGTIDPPMAKALVFSASATGAAADELIAGTIVDRVVVQRFAGVADKWERLGGVLAFPVLVAVISRNPNLLPVLEDDLRDATLDVIIASMPTYEKQAQREKKAVDALRRLGQIDERYAASDDPIGLILQDLFNFAPTATVEGDATPQ